MIIILLQTSSETTKYLRLNVNEENSKLVLD